MKILVCTRYRVQILLKTSIFQSRLTAGWGPANQRLSALQESHWGQKVSYVHQLQNVC